MARESVVVQVEKALALIPPNGEMEFTAWQAAARAAGATAAVDMGYEIKRYGAKFRNEITPTSKKLFITRGA